MDKNAKHLYINTIGCQMNVYDSERISDDLTQLGYQLTPFTEEADLIIVNTCTIRAKAEQKAFSFLGRLTGLKQKKPHLIVAVGGCMAQQEGRKILQRMPHVDLVFGTQAIGRLAAAITRIEAQRCRIVDIEESEAIPDELMHLPGQTAIVRKTKVDSIQATSISRFVTIMRGCDNYCTYCVVPYVRGREKSRTPQAIVKEIEGLVKTGVREVTLLGQNVNSYGIKEGLESFTKLLERVNQIEGLSRIRFTTSHPKDLSLELMEAFARLEKLCHHIHLPVQSGSSRILKRMNRRYDRATYLEKVNRLRSVCPDIAISSDFIVGFPGETDNDFEQTLDLIARVQFDSLFAFNYSDRPNAPAARFSDKVADDVKNDRLQRLLALQADITKAKNRSRVGSVVPVLVEGLSKKQTAASTQVQEQPQNASRNKHRNIHQNIQWTGRSGANTIVNFFQRPNRQSGEARILPRVGEIMPIRIKRAYSHSLEGVAEIDNSLSHNLENSSLATQQDREHGRRAEINRISEKGGFNHAA